MLQEVGIYQYRHRLQDAAAYKERLEDTLGRIREMAKRDRAAVQSGMGWAINGSAAEGAKMVKDLSKLMLRSYNNEADNIVQTMRESCQHGVSVGSRGPCFRPAGPAGPGESRVEELTERPLWDRRTLLLPIRRFRRRAQHELERLSADDWISRRAIPGLATEQRTRSPHS